MVVHIAECVLGVFAFDGEGKMLASKQFPRDLVEVAGRLASIQMGTPTAEHRELIKDLLEGGQREFTLESEALVNRLQEEFGKAEFELSMPNRAGSILRGKLWHIAKEVGFKDVDKFAREVNFILTRRKLRTEAAQRDKLIIQSTCMLDNIDKFTNVLVGLVREWYSIHFPELDRLVPNHELYLKLVLSLGPRERFTLEALKDVSELPEDEANKIVEAAQSSLGARFDEIDIGALQDCIKKILDLYELRGLVAEYIDGLMTQIAPNLRTVVGGLIGARLISIAGGLEKLSRLPASTTQVLGAEKALFRALKTRGRPPKHGVIYQYPDVRGAPRQQRGKIARALSGKISIAARVDAMSGEFVGDKLAADLRARITDIITRGEKGKL
ncbi:MAG: C/D box methylation guide ribonucleoprotein complex aNOP56 subunit [Hadesarchaea archaeon]|nr:C/D box methylation guide ribonucleoprotein complex aNOP56 subunit [Hadesarchaea archaeon]